MTPLPGDAGFITWGRGRKLAGHLTPGEWLERIRTVRIVHCYYPRRPQRGAVVIHLPDPGRSIPGRFHNDPRDTEQSAAMADEPRLGTHRARVLDEFRVRGRDGLTDYEMNEILVPGRRSVSAGTRRAELIRDGWPIVDSGRRRPTDTDTPAIVWVLVGDRDRAYYSQDVGWGGF